MSEVKEFRWDSFATAVTQIQPIPESQYQQIHKGMPIYHVLFNETEVTLDFLKCITMEQLEIAWNNISYAHTCDDAICEDDPEIIGAYRNDAYQYVIMREWLDEAQKMKSAPRKVTFI